MFDAGFLEIELVLYDMSPNRRILTNIVAPYARSLHAPVCGLFISLCALPALGKSGFGVYGVVGAWRDCGGISVAGSGNYCGDSHQHHISETPVFVGCGVRAVGTNENEYVSTN